MGPWVETDDNGGEDAHDIDAPQEAAVAEQEAEGEFNFEVEGHANNEEVEFNFQVEGPSSRCSRRCPSSGSR